MYGRTIAGNEEALRLCGEEREGYSALSEDTVSDDEECGDANLVGSRRNLVVESQ